MFNNLSRREFVKVTTGFVAGAAAAGSAPLIDILTANAQSSTGYKIVAYFENWAQYRQGGGKFLPEQIDPSLFTHINFAFGIFGFVTKSVDPNNPRLTNDYKIQPVEWNDQTVLYPGIQKLKQSNPNLKTLLSIGGWSFNDPQDPNNIGTYTYNLFSQMVSSAAGRQQFISSAIQYAKQYGFNGIDIDWEYPGYNGRGGKPEDLANFLALMQEFRSAISGQDFLLTMAAPAIVPTGVPAQYHSNPGDYFKWLSQCAQYFDWLNVMSYDYHGAFPDDKVTGVNAPLPEDSTPGGPFSIKNTVEAYLAAGIPTSKIVLGMSSYGRSFKVSSALTSTDNGPEKSYSGPGSAGTATAIPGVLAYYEISNGISSGSLTRQWHQPTLTPYAYNSQTGEWVSYDDVESIGYKTSYLIEKKLAGSMIFGISFDDFQKGFPLIRAAKNILEHPETRPALPDSLLGGTSQKTIKTPVSMGLLLPSQWSTDQQLKTEDGGVVGTTGPGALAEYNGLLWCIHPGASNSYQDDAYLWYTVFDGTKWSKDQKLKTDGGDVVGTYGSPILAVFGGKLYCVHQGSRLFSQNYQYLWYTVFDGTKWSKDQKLNTNGGGDVGTSAPTGLAAFGNQLHCIHPGGQNGSDAAYMWYTAFDGTKWSKDQQLETDKSDVVGTYGSPALAEYNGELWCIHRGGDNISRHSEYLWYTKKGNTWSKDQPLNAKEGVGATLKTADNATKFAPAALAKFDNKLFCLHQGGSRDDDKNYLWCTVFNGITWSTDQKVSYPISSSIDNSVLVNTDGPPALGVYKGQLFCTHEVNGYLRYLTVSANSQSGGQPNWIEARGQNSYVYYELDSSATDRQGLTTSRMVTVDPGAPFLYAVLFSSEDSVDFPLGAMLTITGSDGTVYNQESNTEKLLVIMSGGSLRCLIVKDPKPGSYKIDLKVPTGVDFHFEFETLPSRNVAETIKGTLAQVYQASQSSQRLQKRGLSNADLPLAEVNAIAALATMLPNRQEPPILELMLIGNATDGNVSPTNLPNNLQSASSSIYQSLATNPPGPGRSRTTQTQEFNEYWAGGRVNQRTRNNHNYGSVRITLESLNNPPSGYGPRPIRVAGFIIADNFTVNPRGTTPQPSAGFITRGEGPGDVHAGHLMALDLGGPDVPQNIVPQWGQWQANGPWRAMERDLAQRAQNALERAPANQPRTLYYVVDVVYRNQGDITPTLVAWSFPARFRVRRWIRNLSDPIPNPDDPNSRPDSDEEFEGEPAGLS